MKKIFLFIAAVLFLIVNGYSQADFNTGGIAVRVNQYGKIITSSTAGVDQMWRTSILVGTSASAVFDYQNDAEEHDPTVLVANPAQSDFEIYGAYDNTYSGDPPDVIVKLNAYGWTNGAYIIVKFRVQNSGSTAYNALVGLDIIPYIDEEDGHDTVTYNNTAGVIWFHRGNQTHSGIKLLSAALTSLYSFEYYDDYYVDSDYWNWMNYGSVQPIYPSNSDTGSVSITSQQSVTLAPGATVTAYYAMTIGATQQAMLANMATAVAKYQNMVVSVGDNHGPASEFRLDQNAPNPFRQSTDISYQLPDNGKVSLKVYDVVGNEVATLINANQTAGHHSVHFQASELPAGVYYYTLRFNGETRSNKMFIIR